MNTMLEPRMVAAKIHGPFTAAGWEHRFLRIAASSQGGFAIVAIRPFSSGSLSVGPGGTGHGSMTWRDHKRALRSRIPHSTAKGGLRTLTKSLASVLPRVTT